MTQDPSFYPLIGYDSDFVPMFQCRDEKTAQASHRFYLSESVPHYYRLCSTEGIEDAEDCGYAVHCPRCGTIMQTVASPVNTHKRALYACKKCNQ